MAKNEKNMKETKMKKIKAECDENEAARVLTSKLTFVVKKSENNEKKKWKKNEIKKDKQTTRMEKTRNQEWHDQV